MSNIQDLRKESRLNTQGEAWIVKINEDHSPETVSCQIGDISETGICLTHILSEISTGSELCIMTRPKGETEAITLIGRVKWCRHSPEQNYSIGWQLISDDYSEIPRWKELLTNIIK